MNTPDHQTLTVNLAERSYPIHIGHGGILDTPLFDAIANTPRTAWVVDENVAKLSPYAKTNVFNKALEGGAVIRIPSGEPSKSVSQLAELFDFFAEKQIGRDGLVLAIGGGVTGDLAGYAAASWLRGVGFIQVPTTLLAMVDSSVGGKTGINIPAGKNLVGAFWQPQAVFIDTAFLETLPPREFSAGMAEVIKYGMLHDYSLFDKLEQVDTLTWNSEALPDIIRRCCEIKAEIVAADEKEMAKDGGRALLNLGHTFAHAIENVAGYGEYLHGEAVGVGLVMAARLSQELGHMGDAEVERTRKLCERYDLPVDISRHDLSLEKLIAAMYRDKKVRGGKLRFVAMKELGKAITVDGIDESLVRKLWLEFGAKDG